MMWDGMKNLDKADKASITGSNWPHCVLSDGNCIGFDLVSLLGPNVNQVLMEYIWNSAEGSRLTLQKNRQGFTVQVTGEVHRSQNDDGVDLEQFKWLKRHLDSLKNSNDSTMH